VLTITPIPKALAIAEANKYPTLTGNGFNYVKFANRRFSNAEIRKDREYLWSDNGLLQIAYAIQYSKENRVSPESTSYGIKHAIENWSGAHGNRMYICNGCAILGLSLAGYEVKIVDNSPNCFFRKRRQI